jgi:hypothetical protein
MEFESKGDPRVLFVMNLVLSFVFAYVVVRGAAFVSELTFSWQLVGIVTLLLMLLTRIFVW